MSKNTHKIALISLGCPKALVDSEKIVTKLKAENYIIINDCVKADLVIINTCGFINDAIEESLDTIGKALEQNGKVIVTGCLGAKKSLILDKYPQVLGITGPNSCDEAISIVHQYLPLLQPVHTINPNYCVKLTPSHYAYLKISEGCNQNCTYCIIPNLRGKLTSRPINEVLQEATDLVAHGVKELLVISQDTGAYGTDLREQKSLWCGKKIATDLLTLVEYLSKLGIWIRLHYLYPYSQIDQLLPLMKKKKILPYLDVPLQHINQRILKAMRRPANNGEDMLKRIEKWRTICPDIVIRSTFIVGFPGETAVEFNELLDFLKKAQLDHVGCFKYSPVEGAKANEFPKQIPEKIKAERFHRLMTLQQQISAKKLKHKVGKIIDVLIDGIKGTQAIGRSYIDAPDIDGVVYIKHAQNIKIGDLVKVIITDSNEYDLFGEKSGIVVN
jgi:ribosomal protein S12 methylthiotransferase